MRLIFKRFSSPEFLKDGLVILKMRLSNFVEWPSWEDGIYHQGCRTRDNKDWVYCFQAMMT